MFIIALTCKYVLNNIKKNLWWIILFPSREGKPTSDPNEALPSGGGCGLPLGGFEETSGYKVTKNIWIPFFDLQLKCKINTGWVLLP